MTQRMQSRTAIPGRYHYSRYQSRLTLAVTLSLLAHAFVLSLQFGLPGLGLPGLKLPWNQRRAQPVGLSVVLSNTKHVSDAASEPTISDAHMQAPEHTEPPQHQPPSARASLHMVPIDRRSKKYSAATSDTHGGKTEHVTAVPKSGKRKRAALASAARRLMTQDDMGQNTFSVPLPILDDPDQTVASNASVRPELAQPDVPALATPVEPSALEQAREQEAAAQRVHEAEARAQEELRLAQELEARRQAEEIAALARQKREEEDSARRARELDAQRHEEQRLQDQARAARLAQDAEARRQAQEAEQQQALALALQQQAEQRRLEEETARRIREAEARKREELRLQEEAKAQRAAMEMQARRQEDALRQKQAEERAAQERVQAEARRQAEAAAAQQREQALADKGRAAGAVSMTRNSAAGSLAARALEQARNADDLPNVPPSHQQLQAADPARRRSVLGRVDHDVGVMMYMESWRLKIERNGRLNYKQSLVDSAYTEPIVTVAVRSDGSIEEIIFHRSSGRPELDEAVRRIIRLNARYAAFPPELARRFDVIEIRHTWNFDDKLRLLDEVR